MKMLIRTHEGGGKSFETDGILVKITDKVPNRFFLVRDEACMWRIVEYTTGASVGCSEHNRNTVIFKVRQSMSTTTSAMILDAVASHIKKYGVLNEEGGEQE